MARTTGAKQISVAETRLIEIAIAAGQSHAQIAAGLGRSRVSIWKVAKRLTAGSNQPVLPLDGEGARHGQ